MSAPAVVSLQHAGERSSVVLITIGEGKNRQIRRMLHGVGHGCLELEVSYTTFRSTLLSHGSVHASAIQHRLHHHCPPCLASLNHPLGSMHVQIASSTPNLQR